MTIHKKRTLLALSALPVVAALSGTAESKTTHADKLSVAEASITIDHLGRPTVNGRSVQPTLQKSSGDISNVFSSLRGVNIFC